MCRNVNFKVIDKNVHVPKITKTETVSRLAAENELIKFKAPSAASYIQTQTNVGTESRQITFGKDKRGDRTPSPDFKRELNPDYDAIKKVAP